MKQLVALTEKQWKIVKDALETKLEDFEDCCDGGKAIKIQAVIDAINLELDNQNDYY